ncbi:hypothetical protein CABS01_16673 [Colletotrichum abscissum]|uniref:Uncharacterized protein n=1 Tax=Colletotrichum abscissum TaxID=1671311 RepID=A0A9P9X165_9PEZI|nr:uncharacterized protein CABS01_16673 [Colletotrichum abscissum]KAI3530629.1 hypothetical protein CABS02_14432 [Colletotrichum abscissum]KAK1517384.1 hypothetical protein CABS01_16673 [Colletotrichum abscissum]
MSTYAAKGQWDYPPQVELCWLYAAANDDVHAEALLACQGFGCTVATEGIPILWEIDVSIANSDALKTSFAVMSSTPDGCRFLNFAAALIAFVKNEDGAKALALLMAASVSDPEQRVPSSADLTMILEALVKYLPLKRNKDLASQYSAAARHHSDPEAVDLASWIKGWVVRNHNNTHDTSAFRRRIKAFLDWCQRPEGKSLNDSDCKGGSGVS